MHSFTSENVRRREKSVPTILWTY